MIRLSKEPMKKLIPLFLFAVCLFSLIPPQSATAQTALQIRTYPTESTLPTLIDRQLCRALDTGRLWIGTNGSGNKLVAVPGLVQDEGTTLSLQTNLNFVGAGVTATIDGANSRYVVTIPATVSSIAFALPSALFAVSGSPVTSAGTITATLQTQIANTVFAGPTTGSAAAPTFRALVPLDYPAFIASGSSHSRGAVPDPGSTAGTTKYLREDATWATPPGAGVPSGTTGQTLRYSATNTLAASSVLTNDGTDVKTTGSFFASGAYSATPFATNRGVWLGTSTGVSRVSLSNGSGDTGCAQIAYYGSGFLRLMYSSPGGDVPVVDFTNGGDVILGSSGAYVRPIQGYKSVDSSVGITVTDTNGAVYKDGLRTATNAAPTVSEYRGAMTASATLLLPSTSSVRTIMVPLDATAGNLVITLPAASSAFSTTVPFVFRLKRVDNTANTVTIQSAGSDTIDYGTPTNQLTIVNQNDLVEMTAYSTAKWWAF